MHAREGVENGRCTNGGMQHRSPGAGRVTDEVLDAQALVPWIPVAVLPSQLAGHKTDAHCPELRLVAAVLEDALRIISRNAAAPRKRRRLEFLEVCDWLLDDSCDWPFAFPNVCDLLGLDAAAVRQSLLEPLGPLHACFEVAPVAGGVIASRRNSGRDGPQSRRILR